MSSVEIIAELGAVAEGQWGYMTTAQAGRLGVARDRLSKLARRGVFESVGHGVYRMAGVPSLLHEEIYVSYLALNGIVQETATESSVPALVVGGKSAALLHDMGDHWPRQVELLTNTRVRTNRVGVRLMKQNLRAEDVMTLNGLPVLSGNATIRELIREGDDFSQVSAALLDGLVQGKINLPTLVSSLQEVAPGAGYVSGEALFVSLVQNMPIAQRTQDWYLESALEGQRVA